MLLDFIVDRNMIDNSPRIALEMNMHGYSNDMYDCDMYNFV